MNTRHVRWAARVTGTLLLAFLLFMLIGHYTGEANGPEGMRFNDNKELIAFLFFPIGTIIGLALAYKWEVLGGAIAVGSIVALLVMRSDLLRWSFLAMMLPALLYLAYGWLHQHRAARN